MRKKEVIETLRANYPDACFEQLREAVDIAIEALSEPKIGWIPVSEKLPETGASILVTYSDEEVGIVWSARPKVWGKYEKANSLIFPIAWMPLPEPYRWDGEEK